MHQKRIVAVCLACVELYGLPAASSSNSHSSECYLCPPQSGSKACVLLASHQVIETRRRPSLSHLTNSLGHLFNDPFAN